MAQSCVSLAGSTTCPAFNTSSISTDSFLTGLFPFLRNVTDTQSFDAELRQFISTTYIQIKYQTLFGCQNVNLAETNGLYARYTTSFYCNAIIQNSVDACDLATQNSRPLCADSCADFALSEQKIVSSTQLCGTNKDPLVQLRADFNDCGLPPHALTETCVAGYENEASNCGFESNLQGLCEYCRDSTQNSTDSCCVTSDAESRCQGVTLPVFSSLQPIFPTSSQSPVPSATPSSTPGAATGLSGAQIAGVVVGSVLGAALLVVLVVLCCVLIRRRKMQLERSSLNQPTPPRSGESMAQTAQPRFEVLPGARVTRMTALEGTSEQSSRDQTPRQIYEKSSSSGYNSSPDGGDDTTRAFTKNGKAENQEDNSSSPEQSSPEARGHSEQMSSFKDYYSDDEIRPGDTVSVLWAYQPRANDEFELERGDMLRIVGIWDDGWSTGIRVALRADEWEPGRSVLRDSGVSSASRQEDSPPTNGEIKAFPLVCVCLPQHWRKTIEGESSSSDDRHAPE